MSIARSDAERQPRRRSGNVDGTSRSVYESDFSNPTPLSQSDIPNPRSSREEKEDWGKLSRKEKEYLGSLSPEGRREALLLIKQEAIKQQKEESIKQPKKAEQLLTSVVSTDTPNTIKEELSASPSSEMVVRSSEITTTHSPLFNFDFEHVSAYVMPVFKCKICGAADHPTYLCSYWEEIPPDVKIVNERVFQIICQRCGYTVVNGACLYKCLSPAPRKVTLKPTSWPFDYPPPPPIKELSPPLPYGILRQAIEAGRKCQICGCINHKTFDCSYLLEIPPDAKIFNESQFQIACKRCNLAIVNGACPKKCLPPLRTMVIRKATSSSDTVIHSSSEETTTRVSMAFPLRFSS